MRTISEILLEKVQKKKRKQEKFDNLKQQDRIEYLLRLDKFEREKSNVNPFGMMYVTGIIISYLILLAVCSYQISENLTISIIKSIAPILRFLLLWIITLFLIDIYCKKKEGKYLEKLNKKFLKE